MRSGDAIRIGALTTHAELAASSELRQSVPALAEAAALVGDPAVRNRGTIGGNVAHADPASDLPAVLVALDAQIVSTGPGGERPVPAGEFFTGIMTTALGEDEILTAVVVPVQAAGQGSAYVKFPHPASRYAVVGVAAAVGRDRRNVRHRPRRSGRVVRVSTPQPGGRTGNHRHRGRRRRRGRRGRCGRARSRTRRDRRHLRVSRVSLGRGARVRQARADRSVRADRTA